MHASISIAKTTFTRDSIPFDLLDIDVNLGRLHTHKTKIDCKDCKVSLRGEKNHIHTLCARHRQPSTLRSIIRASRLSY